MALQHKSRSVLVTSSTQSYYPTKTSPTSPPAKKQRMSLTQTYYIASSARTKLGQEASRADHNLRLLVGHANLLDTLMVELQDAEREQEAWFNDSVRQAGKPSASRPIQWIDSIAEELEEDSEDDSDSDVYEEDVIESSAPVAAELYTVSSVEVDEDEDEDDYDHDFPDFEYDDEHALTRVDSHPPELVHGDSDSEDESLPSLPSHSPHHQAQPIMTTPYFHKVPQHSQHEYLADNIIIRPQSGPMISAY